MMESWDRESNSSTEYYDAIEFQEEHSPINKFGKRRSTSLPNINLQEEETLEVSPRIDTKPIRPVAVLKQLYTYSAIKSNIKRSASLVNKTRRKLKPFITITPATPL
ncbi:uncharacterized protein LOC105681318 [Bombus impatiens]|uniref:Uncharacterized protein LOC105681318 n=1 Tax=Bombus impatiens TaxID=132113 RepID=A0A6P3V1Z7_BOMIM|nr:uncharacterized protein LOC105681318 [Bombus impatiens]XP_012245794.1 uncharacterized protein LOC105681318 [Bombus impatiens]